MMKGDHGPTKLLHALTWSAFDHASHAPQVRACNYYLYVLYIIISLLLCIHVHYHVVISHQMNALQELIQD